MTAYIQSIYLRVSDNVYALLADATGFDWDEGNSAKLMARHSVDPGECEQAFFVEPLIVSFDEKHSAAEQRWRALGQTVAGRTLYLVFTMRGTLIRVIHARAMNRKERHAYGQGQAVTEDDSGF